MFNAQAAKKILEDHEKLEAQIIKILKSKNLIKKGYALDHFHLEDEGVDCLIVEKMAYSEDDYRELLTWEEIDQYIEKENLPRYM